MIRRAEPSRLTRGALSRRAARLLVLALLLLAPAAGSAHPPEVVVSLERCTMRVETGRGRRVFPIGVGRLLPDGKEPALGTFHTGPDPADPRFYLAARNQPAFHRGLPFLRLDRRVRPQSESVGEHLFGIHGPVTPTLIWGRVSAGCIRMQPQQLRWLFAFARRHPGLSLRMLPGPDLVLGREVQAELEGPPDPGCPEAGLGARPLRRAILDSYLHDRLCGGVDHWFVVELKGGDTLRASIQHGGALRIELYGIRGISEVAAGRSSLIHTVPGVHRNRGDRYLRVFVDPARPRGPAQPYTLQLSLGQ